jgi:hypothetical protein
MALMVTAMPGVHARVSGSDHPVTSIGSPLTTLGGKWHILSMDTPTADVKR